MGAAIKQLAFLSPQQIDVFKSVLGELPYNVVWKWDNETMDEKPDNVFISSWINQTAVLAQYATHISAMKSVVFVIFFLVIGVVVPVRSSKILFLSCTPAPSHQKPFQVIWKGLAEKGHEVHVLTPNPLENSTLPNLVQYNISDLYEYIKTFTAGKSKYYLKKPTFIEAFVKDVYITVIFNRFYERCISHEATQSILTNNKHFDAVIVEWLFPTLGGFAAHFRAPLIGITSLGAPLVSMDTVGNPGHPIIAPDMNLPLTRAMTFRERIFSGLYSIYVRIHYHLFVLPREDALIKRHISNNLPYLGDIEKNISLLLLNRNPVFHRVMPMNPAAVELGGIKFPKANQSLSPDLKRFLDGSKRGVIYFSLGSSMKAIYLTDDVIGSFQRVFRDLPYDVLWKWENDTMAGKPDNVLINKWIPQVAILEHPNVKLFITQGGLQSTEEAIAAHKPIIGIPFHSDQTSNVDTCVKYGMGKMLDLEDITVERLRSYINEIMDNPSFAENAKYLDDLMKDQPQDGLDKAIWWIEYVIRHKGAKHLRSIAVDMPWWQYMMLDILAFLSAVFLSVLLTLYFSVRLLYILVNSIFKSKMKKGGKKKVQ
ncbi:hypothetical protein GWI33_000431 [Rhynchophorus ferrugineus]|uniref:Glucuronosyltransferase n=2 Tax=Rhynchophorus ferrugineus TaxID=354439 RepID=A0A834HMJ0_RHYFE|nr:hypothetical protein GWI33_000431 [Rhynchophorus ferrugineus]